MKVFLGSSKEKEGLMTEIAVWVGQSMHRAMRWRDKEAFPAGTITFNRLLELTNLVGAAAFIFSDDDRTWYRGHEMPSTRDNVILEYGLFLGKLGPDRVIIVRDGNPIVPNDLAGLNVIVYDERNPFDAEDRFVHWLNNVRPIITPRPAVADVDETRICRMLQVISFLDQNGIRTTPGHIFHLLTDEDRILEEMLVRAIEFKWVHGDPDPSGLMIYHLTPEGKARLRIEAE